MLSIIVICFALNNNSEEILFEISLGEKKKYLIFRSIKKIGFS